MCNQCDNSEMAGLHEGHLPLLQTAMPRQTALAADLFAALTDTLNPHLPMLPALLAMAEAVESRDFGVLQAHRLVRLPLSVIGPNMARYRDLTLVRLHETVLSARMSDVTIEAVHEVLRRHGLCILFLCSCGVAMGRCEDIRAYYGSDDHVRMDRVRSAIDAAGSPVVEVATLSEIPRPNMDLHMNRAEERLIARIAELTKTAAQAGHPAYLWIERELQAFINTANPLLVAA